MIKQHQQKIHHKAKKYEASHIKPISSEQVLHRQFGQFYFCLNKFKFSDFFIF